MKPSSEPLEPLDPFDVHQCSDEELMHRVSLATRALPDAPAWLVASAVAAWQPGAARPSLRQRLEALLMFDSWAPQAVPALRAGRQTTRHFLFHAEGMDIDLQVRPSATDRLSPSYAVTGQVLGPAEGGDISIVQDGKVTAVVQLDSFGEFRFDGLPAGSCTMKLQLGDAEVDLPTFDIGGASPV